MTTQSDFLGFAETCEKIGATRSKLEKVSILSNYLRALSSEEDIKIAVTFLSGRVFPPGENDREANVGYSILWRAISEMTGLTDRDLSKHYLNHGDLGDVFAEVLSNRDAKNQLFQMLERDKLSLELVFKGFQDLSKAIGKNALTRKKKVLQRIFSLISNPLEGKYIIKILAGEMRIGMVEGLAEESIAKSYSKTLEEIRQANLLIANPGKVAILAKSDRLAEARLEPLHPTNFMLASSASDSFDLSSKFKMMPVFVEYKYDGIRVQAHKLGREVKLFSRNLADITKFFPEIESSLGTVEGSSLILDGEIIAFQNGEPLPFQMLQRRLRKLSRSSSDAPIRYFVFDLLEKGSSLIETPFLERIKALRALKLPEIISFSEQKLVSTPEGIQEMFDRSKELGYEGLVAKDPASFYSPGKRGNSWVKLKKELDTLDVVIVAAEYGHGKRAGVISDYTFAVRDGSDLRVVGKAYSGLNDEEINEMTLLLKSITIKDLGYRRTVTPQVVLEVAFDAIQRSARHDSGYALRFPRIKRIRNDKSVTEIDSLERVRKIYEGQKIRI